MTDLETCPGCGAKFSPIEGPTHRYMLSSPACWAAYGEVLAAEYSSPELLPVHRLSVDTYAVQHPGKEDRQSIQSVALHLCRLIVQHESPRPPLETNDVMLNLSEHKQAFEKLTPPKSFRMTVADIQPVAGSAKHAEAVRAWARSAYEDWQEHHDELRAWIDATAPELLGS